MSLKDTNHLYTSCLSASVLHLFRQVGCMLAVRGSYATMAVLTPFIPKEAKAYE